MVEAISRKDFQTFAQLTMQVGRCHGCMGSISTSLSSNVKPFRMAITLFMMELGLFLNSTLLPR